MMKLASTQIVESNDILNFDLSKSNNEKLMLELTTFFNLYFLYGK